MDTSKQPNTKRAWYWPGCFPRLFGIPFLVANRRLCVTAAARRLSSKKPRFYLLGKKVFLRKMEYSVCQKRGTTKKSWVPDGNRTHDLRTPVGRSNRWATGRLVASEVIFTEFVVTRFLHTARISHVKSTVCDSEERKMVNFKLGKKWERWNIQFFTSVGQRKKSKSPTGIEPMTSRTPVGRSNHSATGRLVCPFKYGFTNFTLFQISTYSYCDETK